MKTTPFMLGLHSDESDYVTAAPASEAVYATTSFLSAAELIGVSGCMEGKEVVVVEVSNVEVFKALHIPPGVVSSKYLVMSIYMEVWVSWRWGGSL
jgi:hypothetical protein